VWQYNFTNILNPFPQKQGEIYWLDVQAQPLDPSTVFGWKTTNPRDPRTPHFMDDAVFADTAGFNGPLVTPWQPMVYPVGQHPYGGQSIDQAFVITPEPGTSIDQAFVITPEPGTLTLFGAAVFSLLACAWRRRRRMVL
jgi:hypothetical protein